MGKLNPESLNNDRFSEKIITRMEKTLPVLVRPRQGK